MIRDNMDGFRVLRGAPPARDVTPTQRSCPHDDVESVDAWQSNKTLHRACLVCGLTLPNERITP